MISLETSKQGGVAETYCHRGRAQRGSPSRAWRGGAALTIESKRAVIMGLLPPKIQCSVPNRGGGEELGEHGVKTVKRARNV